MARRKSAKNKISIKILKYIVTGILAVFILAVVGIKSVAAVKHSKLFQVKRVGRDPELQFIESYALDTLVGKSIFSVSLKKVQRTLKNKYPQIDDLRVIRRFPDEIYVTAKSRKPFASIVGTSGEIIIDNEGVALTFDPSSNPPLPAIRGVPLSGKVMLGRPLRHRELKVALEILKEVDGNGHLGRVQVDDIDVGYLSKINMKLSSGVKVILDRDRVGEKVKKLGVLVSQGNIDFEKFNYVDLRFKEPVLGHE